MKISNIDELNFHQNNKKTKYKYKIFFSLIYVFNYQNII